MEWRDKVKGIFLDGIDPYIESLLPGRDAVLQEMEDRAESLNFPIIGAQVGRLLYQIARLKNPKHIFEMGSGFGYSAYWLAKGASGAQIICTEMDNNNIRLAESWLLRAGLAPRIRFYHGTAQNILSEIGGEYDLILNDVNKEQYPQTFHLALKHLAPNGLLITDNILWGGRVANPEINDPNTLGVREYNRLIFETPGIFSSVVPIRDGIAISMKI